MYKYTQDNMRVVWTKDNGNTVSIPLSKLEDYGIDLADVQPYEAPQQSQEDYIRSHRLACMSYQLLYVDTNFFALLTAAIGGDKAGEKTASVTAWCDALWADQYSRIEANSDNLDYSNNGKPDYTFTEVRAEVTNV